MLKTEGIVGTQKCGDSHTRWTEPWWYPCKATSPDTLGVSFLSPSCPDILVLYIRCISTLYPVFASAWYQHFPPSLKLFVNTVLKRKQVLQDLGVCVCV